MILKIARDTGHIDVLRESARGHNIIMIPR